MYNPNPSWVQHLGSHSQWGQTPANLRFTAQTVRRTIQNLELLVRILEERAQALDMKTIHGARPDVAVCFEDAAQSYRQQLDKEYQWDEHN